MTIVAARRYAAGQLADESIRIDGVERGLLPSNTFDWVGLTQPTPEELELVRSQFGLHSLSVEDALAATQLPKIETYGRQAFIIARTAALEGAETIDYGQTSIFLGPDFIITVRLGSARAHNALRARLESHPERLAEGPDFVAHAILDFIVDGFQPIIDEIEVAVQTMEERAIQTFPDQATIRRLFRLRRQLRRFERITGPMEEVCDRLAKTQVPAVDPSAQIWFRDVLDHVRQTKARVTSLKETLASIVETAGLLEQHRQGQITRQLAAWAAILAVPTAIAGIYGMNFKFMPELSWHNGYYYVLGAIATICIGLWWRFRRIGWL
ncbi:MAG: magnesium and cobalt transport protein CorA [Novosphingobium sp.]